MSISLDLKLRGKLKPFDLTPRPTKPNQTFRLEWNSARIFILLKALALASGS